MKKKYDDDNNIKMKSAGVREIKCANNNFCIAHTQRLVYKTDNYMDNVMFYIINFLNMDNKM